MNEAQRLITSMTKEDFASLPMYGEEFAGFDPNKDSFSSLVIIPTDRMHDSGYQCMEFVPVDRNGKALCRINGIADVVCIDGIERIGSGCLMEVT